MSKFVCLVVLAVLLGLSADGQVIINRQCPNHPILTPFHPAQYSGNWFEIERYDTGTQGDGDCTQSQYTLVSPSQFNVQYNMLVGPQPVQINGGSFISFPNESPLRAMMNLTFGGPPANSNYWVLNTDYDQYSVVWFCENISATQSRETAWVLSRTRTLPAGAQASVNNIVNQFLDPNELRPTIQDPARCG